jgi:organic hydroperoxide reductase OsmC/OhrA
MAFSMILGMAKEGCPVSGVLNAKISLEATLVGWMLVEHK